MLQSAHPRYEALHAHAESGVRYRAELTQIDVPVESLAWKLMFVQALQQQIQVVDALAAADDFAVSLGGDEIDAQGEFRPVRGGLKVEGLDTAGIAIHQDRTIQILGQKRFVGVAEIPAPLNLAAFR